MSLSQKSKLLVALKQRRDLIEKPDEAKPVLNVASEKRKSDLISTQDSAKKRKQNDPPATLKKDNKPSQQPAPAVFRSKAEIKSSKVQEEMKAKLQVRLFFVARAHTTFVLCVILNCTPRILNDVRKGLICAAL